MTNNQPTSGNPKQTSEQSRWFSKELVEGSPIELLSEIQESIDYFTYQVRLILYESENLKRLRSLKNNKKLNILDEAVGKIEPWIDIISLSYSFLNEITENKEYIFDNEETKEAQPSLKEALSLIELFCREGHTFMLGFVCDIEDADTFVKKQELISGAEYFVSFLKSLDISNKLELVNSKLRTYCVYHTRETKQRQPGNTLAQATPETDTTLIYLSQAAEFYNIPKSTISKAAAKSPGEQGYLWSGRKGRRVFLRKNDCQKLAQSRTKLRNV